MTLTTALLLAACGGLLLRAPAELTLPLKALVADAARPGQQLLLGAISTCEDWQLRARESAQLSRTVRRLRDDLASTRLELERSRIAAAQLRSELQEQRTGSGPYYAGETGEPLLMANLLEARILGNESAEWWRAGRWIDRGALQGVEESALVLEGTQTLIDQGRDADVNDGQPVYAGRYVVGRIALAGRWSSLVQPVSDPNYSAAARLMHRTSRGYLDGPEGVLEGHRDGMCRLKFITSTVPVQVGDEVVTSGRDGAFPLPMRYGTIVKAELPEGAPHWEIIVQPECRQSEITTVQIFRRIVNRERLLAN